MVERTDAWDADRYERFRDQREQPALDLLARVRPAPGGRAIDLGCGAGRYTTALHERVGAVETVGVDSSRSMLAAAGDRMGTSDLGEAQPAADSPPAIRFVEADLTTLGTGPLAGSWDVLFANASLQWLPDHATVLAELVRHLRPGGQLHFQVPANYAHPSHTIADEIGQQFGLEPLDRAAGALTASAYAEILDALGLVDLDVTLRVYPHRMTRTDEVIEWVSGTLLTRFRVELDDDDFDDFRRRYRAALLDRLGDPGGAEPYFYAFARILCSAHRPGLTHGRDG